MSQYFGSLLFYVCILLAMAFTPQHKSARPMSSEGPAVIPNTEKDYIDIKLKAKVKDGSVKEHTPAVPHASKTNIKVATSHHMQDIMQLPEMTKEQAHFIEENHRLTPDLVRNSHHPTKREEPKDKHRQTKVSQTEFTLKLRKRDTSELTYGNSQLAEGVGGVDVYSQTKRRRVGDPLDEKQDETEDSMKTSEYGETLAESAPDEEDNANVSLDEMEESTEETSEPSSSVNQNGADDELEEDSGTQTESSYDDNEDETENSQTENEEEDETTDNEDETEEASTDSKSTQDDQQHSEDDETITENTQELDDEDDSTEDGISSSSTENSQPENWEDDDSADSENDSADLSLSSESTETDTGDSDNDDESPETSSEDMSTEDESTSSSESPDSEETDIGDPSDENTDIDQAANGGLEDAERAKRQSDNDDDSQIIDTDESESSDEQQKDEKDSTEEESEESPETPNIKEDKSGKISTKSGSGDKLPSDVTPKEPAVTAEQEEKRKDKVEAVKPKTDNKDVALVENGGVDQDPQEKAAVETKGSSLESKTTDKDAESEGKNGSKDNNEGGDNGKSEVKEKDETGRSDVADDGKQAEDDEDKDAEEADDKEDSKDSKGDNKDNGKDGMTEDDQDDGSDERDNGHDDDADPRKHHNEKNDEREEENKDDENAKGDDKDSDKDGMTEDDQDDGSDERDDGYDDDADPRKHHDDENDESKDENKDGENAKGDDKDNDKNGMTEDDQDDGSDERDDGHDDDADPRKHHDDKNDETKDENNDGDNAKDDEEKDSDKDGMTEDDQDDGSDERDDGHDDDADPRKHHDDKNDESKDERKGDKGAKDEDEANSNDKKAITKEDQDEGTDEGDKAEDSVTDPRKHHNDKNSRDEDKPDDNDKDDEDEGSDDRDDENEKNNSDKKGDSDDTENGQNADEGESNKAEEPAPERTEGEEEEKADDDSSKQHNIQLTLQTNEEGQVKPIKAEIELGSELKKMLHQVMTGKKPQQMIVHWSTWSSWSACTVSCGEGGVQERTRECLQPPCTEDEDEKRQCDNQPACVVTTVSSAPNVSTPAPTPAPGPGRWGEWSKWSQCSVTCGMGAEVRKRNCTPSNCQGPTTKSRKCIKDACKPVNRESPVQGATGHAAKLKCAYDHKMAVQEIYWVSPKGRKITGSDSRFSVDGDTLTIVSTRDRDEGTYHCVVVRHTGKVDTSDATLKVNSCHGRALCMNGGTCISNSNSPDTFRFRCFCVDGYSGQRCQKRDDSMTAIIVVVVVSTFALIQVIALAILFWCRGVTTRRRNGSPRFRSWFKKKKKPEGEESKPLLDDDQPPDDGYEVPVYVQDEEAEHLYEDMTHPWDRPPDHTTPIHSPDKDALRRQSAPAHVHRPTPHPKKSRRYSLPAGDLSASSRIRNLSDIKCPPKGSPRHAIEEALREADTLREEGESGSSKRVSFSDVSSPSSQAVPGLKTRREVFDSRTGSWIVVSNANVDEHKNSDFYMMPTNHSASNSRGVSENYYVEMADEVQDEPVYVRMGAGASAGGRRRSSYPNSPQKRHSVSTNPHESHYSESYRSHHRAEQQQQQGDEAPQGHQYTQGTDHTTPPGTPPVHQPQQGTIIEQEETPHGHQSPHPEPNSEHDDDDQRLHTGMSPRAAPLMGKETRAATYIEMSAAAAPPSSPQHSPRMKAMRAKIGEYIRAGPAGVVPNNVNLSSTHQERYEHYPRPPSPQDQHEPYPSPPPSLHSPTRRPYAEWSPGGPIPPGPANMSPAALQELSDHLLQFGITPQSDVMLTQNPATRLFHDGYDDDEQDENVNNGNDGDDEGDGSVGRDDIGDAAKSKIPVRRHSSYVEHCDNPESPTRGNLRRNSSYVKDITKAEIHVQNQHCDRRDSDESFHKALKPSWNKLDLTSEEHDNVSDVSGSN